MSPPAARGSSCFYALEDADPRVSAETTSSSSTRVSLTCNVANNGYKFEFVSVVTMLVIVQEHFPGKKRVLQVKSENVQIEI